MAVVGQYEILYKLRKLVLLSQDDSVFHVLDYQLCAFHRGQVFVQIDTRCRILYECLRVAHFPDIVVKGADPGYSRVAPNCNNCPFSQVGNLKRVLESSGSLGRQFLQKDVFGV